MASVAAAGPLESINPATLEPVGAVARTPPEDVPALVEAAREAQSAWACSSLAERARLLARVRRVLVGEADAIAETIVAETAKPPLEAYAAELVVCADNARWLARSLERVLGPERLPLRQLHLRRSSHDAFLDVTYGDGVRAARPRRAALRELVRRVR